MAYLPGIGWIDDADAYREYLYATTGQFTDPWLNFGGPTDTMGGFLSTGGVGNGGLGGYNLPDINIGFGGGNGSDPYGLNGYRGGDQGTTNTGLLNLAQILGIDPNNLDASNIFGIPGTKGIDGTKLLTGIGAILGGIFGGGSNGRSQTGAAGSPLPGNGGAGLNSQLLNQLMQLTGLGLGTYGAINAENARQWNQGAQIDVLNFLRNAYGGGLEQTGAINGSLLPAIQSLLQTGPQGASTQADLGNRLNYLYNSLPGMFTGTVDQSRIPGFGDAMGYLGGAQTANNRALQTAFGNLESGTPELQAGIQRALGMAGGIPGLQTAGNSLLGTSGENALTQALQQAGIQTLGTQGSTPQIEQLRSLAQGLMGPRSELTTANRTAEQILGRNPLLPLDQVVNMSVSGAANDAQNRVETLRKQLLDRTGITGPAVAGGSANTLLKELGDEALGSVADARLKALLGQQELQAGLFGQAGQLLGTAAGASQGYTSQGIQGLVQALSQAANREQNLPQLGLGGGNLALNRLNLGGNLLGTDAGISTSALGALASLIGQGTNRNTSNFGAVQGLLGQAGDLNSQRLNAIMGLQNFGQTQAGNLSQSLASLLGIQNTLGSNQNSLFTSGLGAGGNLMGNWLQFLGQNTGQQAGLFNGSTNVNNVFAGLGR